MKTFFKAALFAATAFISFSAAALPMAYVEGVHYFPTSQKLATSDENKIEVVEMFSYTCPHCFHLESSVHEWAKTLPDDVNFVQVQAIFRDSWLALAKVFYAAQATGNLEKLHEKLFNAIHVEKKRLNTESALLDFVAEQGIDRAKFKKTMDSMSVGTKVKQAMRMSANSGIMGVPSLIINGEYFTSASSAGGVEEMYSVTQFLIDQARAKLNAKAPQEPIVDQ